MAGYDTFEDVPRPFRTLRGGALVLDQINRIRARAEELTAHAEAWPEALGQARQEFMAANHLADGSWAPGAPTQPEGEA